MGPARVVRDLHLAQRGDELLLVLDLAVDRLERLVVEARAGVALRGVERGPAAVALLVGGRELPVGRGVEGAAVDQRGDDAERLVAHALEHVLVGEGADAHERDALEAGVAPGLQEARGQAAGVAGVDAVDVLLQGRQVGRVVLDGQRGPDALHHLAAQLLEHALEAGGGLPAERVVHADGRHPPQLELLVRVVAERMGRLAPRGRGAHDPADRLALRDVVGRGDRIDGRDLVLLDVGRDRVAGGGEQPARHGVDLLLLDQAPHLGQRAGRLRVRVLHDDLHLAARDLVADLLPEEVEAVGHVLAGLREVAGERSEVADADRVGRAGRAGRRGRDRAAHGHEELSSVHGLPPLQRGTAVPGPLH